MVSWTYASEQREIRLAWIVIGQTSLCLAQGDMSRLQGPVAGHNVKVVTQSMLPACFTILLRCCWVLHQGSDWMFAGGRDITLHTPSSPSRCFGSKL